MRQNLEAEPRVQSAEVAVSDALAEEAQKWTVEWQQERTPPLDRGREPRGQPRSVRYDLD